MKKIFVIGIVTIFLMTGLTTVTAMQTKTIDNEEENSAPVIKRGPYEMIHFFPIYSTYTYRVRAYDADDDELTYYWDTDNDDKADYDTGVNCIIFGEISQPDLRVNVIDEHGAESGWSKKVSEAKSKIKTSKPIIDSIENLLDKFDLQILKHFPFLERLLKHF